MRQKKKPGFEAPGQLSLALTIVPKPSRDSFADDLPGERPFVAAQSFQIVLHQRGALLRRFDGEKWCNVEEFTDAVDAATHAAEITVGRSANLSTLRNLQSFTVEVVSGASSKATAVKFSRCLTIKETPFGLGYVRRSGFRELQIGSVL